MKPSNEPYPLEQIAQIKQKKLEEAEKILKEKKEALLKEEQKLKTIEAERDKVKEHRIHKLTQLRENLDAGTATDKIQQMKYYLKTVDEQLKIKEQKVKDQMKLVDTAKAAVESARTDYLKKHQDVEKLKLHREEWDRQQKRFAAYEEQIEGDELGSAMHARKKGKDHLTKRGRNGSTHDDHP